jgi:hypothetical protein
MKKLDNNTLFFGNWVDADLQINDFRDYLVDVNKFIDRKIKINEKKLKDSVFKDVALNMFTESFSVILYDSVMMSLWAFMESQFKTYCNAMQNAMSISLSYSDLSGSSIEKFKTYTQKVAVLDFRLKNENWEDLKAINEIRNYIVHSGVMVRNKKLLEAFVKRNKLKCILLEDRIALNKHSLEIIIFLCKLFIERIYEVALKKYPKDK